MGIFDKLLGNKITGGSNVSGIEVQAQPLTVCAPFTGTALKMDEIPDPVFSQGVLGQGCGVDPTEETVYAPFDGMVIQTTDTKHALGLASVDGIELLIHVGLDTVVMNGEGFTCMVKEGQNIKAGQPLMTFSLSGIKAAGHPATTAVVVTNADDFAGVEMLTTGQVQHGAAILRVNK